MRISNAARAAGCSVRAVRHYHAAGALPEPARTHGGYRDYSLADLADLLRVRALVQAGIPLSAISDPDPSLYDAALARIDARLTALHEQRRHLLALRSGTLGLPADLREMITGIGRDSDYLRLELDSLELMGLCGVAADETWDRMRANLADPARRAEYRRALRPVGPAGIAEVRGPRGRRHHRQPLRPHPGGPHVRGVGDPPTRQPARFLPGL
ncbi:MerR family transcriptional regulator [Corynebacterium suedekumii]|nr:MerR family transcriptional regulator [Corynebacterium suedekumii]